MTSFKLLRWLAGMIFFYGQLNSLHDQNILLCGQRHLLAPLRQPVAPLPLVGTISGGVQPPERYVAERDIVARLTFDGVQLKNIMLHMLSDEWPEIVESMP